MGSIYLALDGDDIGSQLEFHLLHEDIEGLREFARSFNSVLESIVHKLRRNPEISILLLGGDTLLAEMPATHIAATIDLIQSETARTDFTFSGGYGPSLRHAYLALRIAKASGKNRICALPSDIPL